MESRNRSLFLNSTFAVIIFGLIAFTSNSAYAAKPAELKNDQIIQPELERRTIKQAKIDTEDYEVSLYAGALSIEDFGVNTVFGARIAYHITENFFTEFSIANSTASETSFEVLSGGLQLLTDDERDFTYYNISIGYNLFAGESFFNKRAYNSDLYLIGGIGNTNFAGDDNFTWNIGVGYRFIPKDWIAIHVDVRDHIFNSDLLGADKITNNLELTVGVSFFF
ncbi:MAG: outer membrane beta-barrel domain-containing protein [Gammaproteobacteria bacterium]|nr:outer membrane beta-barrel domain-containing protein [Gammaproteobacteria bacterium]